MHFLTYRQWLLSRSSLCRGLPKIKNISISLRFGTTPPRHGLLRRGYQTGRARPVHGLTGAMMFLRVVPARLAREPGGCWLRVVLLHLAAVCRLSARPCHRASPSIRSTTSLPVRPRRCPSPPSARPRHRLPSS